jgi:molecular chaperone GrpE (heat shock protein)
LRAVDEDPQAEDLEAKVEYLRGVAEELRQVAAQLQYDFRRREQLLALAAGFERFAERLEREIAGES